MKIDAILCSIVVQRLRIRDWSQSAWVYNLILPLNDWVTLDKQ